ncbi:hypothetical protein BOTBODRAFT_151091 [Botryobasidium botryosum FD-172 SS1]|uniref:Swiss Army Knife RNA repair protein HAD domain-containing protein n=1 Tax=Botryobasidium botryosum (strain FD-172 SS1) TaxID=930990 RepID=A0A067MXU3_BOTB1|nr:hypothetical protein BOTBODRAFT_151091 [Botryobasidium botryosum FD-172 SS1]
MRPLIAVDMDDVLIQTNFATVEWHNRTYRTAMSLSEYYYYHYWKNPHWGTPSETYQKVTSFYASDYFANAPPVPRAFEGAKALRELGYRLVVVTARGTDQREVTETWLNKHFPNIFEAVHYTSEFKIKDNNGKLSMSFQLGKAQILQKLGAIMMIDDSLDNALSCATMEPRIPILLFGKYEWNKRSSKVATVEDKMSFVERCALKNGDRWWEDEVCWDLPENIVRVSGWDEVVEFARARTALTWFGAPSLQGDRVDLLQRL